MYRYRANITNVVDGDTVDVALQLSPQRELAKGDSVFFDLGFSFYASLVDADRPSIFRTRLRISRINTPETNRTDEREAGLVSEAFVRSWLEERGNRVTVESRKTGKFGRYLAEIYDADGVNLSDLLVEKGLAEWYPGAGPLESSK